MKVAFMHLDLEGQSNARRLAEIMISSVRQTMPDAEIIQLTDEKTPMVAGVDTVVIRRMTAPFLMLYRLDHFRHLPAGRTMFIDTDAVVLRDPSIVFEQAFDVALTRRTGVILVNGRDIVPEMPFNTGVMFSRGPAFWWDCHDYCATLSEEERHWFGDQKAVRVVTERGKHKVFELTCDEFNYSPRRADEDLDGRYVAHYKGPIRKGWLLDKYSQMEAA